MKIKEFNDKCKIGTTVYIGANISNKIEDIDRRNHTAKILHLGWIRCSEFFLTEEEANRCGISAYVVTRIRKRKKGGVYEE